MKNSNYTISILIPIYNSPHCLRDLFITLENNSNPSLLTEIILGDDASDNVTKALIQDIIKNSKLKIKLIEQTKNGGYLNNVNQLYDEAQTDIVVFLNTDTLVPPYWLERILRAFELDNNVVLATPFSTNAATLTIIPNVGQSWLDVDHCLFNITPEYPHAHTAVGFCLAAKKLILSQHLDFNKSTLFDKIYNPGYAEETDLHYRVLRSNLKSVVIDNLLVYHASGSSSFSLKEELNEILRKNKSIFYEKWGLEHKKQEEKYQALKPYERVRNSEKYFIFEKTHRDIDILFVLPGWMTCSGGINVVTEFAKYLTLNNIKASLYCYNSVEKGYVEFLGLFNSWRSIQLIKEKVTSIKVVCATIYHSVSYAREISDFYHSKLIYLVQGPESLFHSGKYFSKVISDYLDNHVQKICVSEFLTDYLNQLKENSCSYIPLGADTHKFYPLGSQVIRDLKAIVVCLRVNETKGTGSLLHSLFLAKQVGFTIHFFGKDSEEFSLYKDLGIYHGDLSHSKLNKLFNSVGYYLDLSYFEGLGLMPLEAANSGAIPILRYNGGSDKIFVNKESAFFIDTVFANKEFFTKLIETDALEINRMRQRALQISDKISLQVARENFLEQIRRLMLFNKAILSYDEVALTKVNNKNAYNHKKWYYRLISSFYQKNKLIIHNLWDKLLYKATEKVLSRFDYLETRLLCQQKILEELSTKLEKVVDIKQINIQDKKTDSNYD